MNTLVVIKIWNHRVGAILWDESKNVGFFEFDKDFVKLPFDLSPIMLPIKDARKGRRVYSFPFLNPETFKGLPVYWPIVYRINLIIKLSILGWLNKVDRHKVSTQLIDCAILANVGWVP